MKWHRNMEDERIRMGTNHKKKNKNLRHRNKSDGGGGGGNIAGLALAVVGFIAVVSLSFINKNRKKGSESNPKPQKASLDKKCKSHEDHEIETKQGLDALVQPSCSITTTKGDSAPW